MEKRGNLILVRRPGETVVIQVPLPEAIIKQLNIDPEKYIVEIDISVIEFLNRRQVRLAFDAPKDVIIFREELLEKPD